MKIQDFIENVERYEYEENDWYLALVGPKGTPYEGGTFSIHMKF